ncbi:DUF3010 family protein [Fundidesulfovibrio agrisoli]|uniref:DUF3010 family protein n=1 Tax=Fundidesulfovibrio agrisoli TaxID=2922717 RepID=UPI001FAC9D6E|nr:DUF3010 family protein [Fundidesulfovibrio agrisoli]
MIVAGIFLTGHTARICTLSGNRQNHSLIAEKFHKIDLNKNPTQEDVEVFSMAFRAFCTDHSVDYVCINRRATSGQGLGGAGTFLLEGILLAKCPVPMIFVHSATVTATNRRHQAQKTKKPTTVDLGKAYDLAFEKLG